MRSFSDNVQAMIDISLVLMIGIAFAAIMVVAFIIWTVRDQLIPDYPGAAGTNASRAAWNTSYGESSSSVTNITNGFDNAVNLLLVAITIFILAIAIGTLLMLRGRQ